MKDFYQFLMKKFNVREGEKFTLVVDDCGNEQYYRNSYITEYGFYDGNNNENNKFTGNFIFKILNGKYRIIRQLDLKTGNEVWYTQSSGIVVPLNKRAFSENMEFINNIDFKAAVLYQNGLVFATQEEAALPCNVNKTKKFYETLYQEFMDGIGLNELQK